MNRKATIVLIAIFLVVAGVLANLYLSFTEFKSGDDRVPRTMLTPGSSNDEIAANSGPISESPHPARQQSISSNESHDGSHFEEIAAQRHWEYEHGYRYDDRARYINLTDAQLRDLATSGDISAIQFLAARSALKDPSEAIYLYERAAAFGSTYALLAIADVLRLHDSAAATTLIAGGDSSTLGYQALVYTLVAELRGNNIASGIKKSEILSEYGITEEAIKRAYAEAEKLLGELEKERVRLTGMPFDNTPSSFGT